MNFDNCDSGLVKYGLSDLSVFPELAARVFQSLPANDSTLLSVRYGNTGVTRC